MLEFNEFQKEQFLKNPAFLRLARSYELYQRLLQESQNDDEKSRIKERMYKIFLKNNLPDENGEDVDKEALSFVKELNKISFQALELCESGSFKPEDLASLFAGSLVAERFIKLWNPKEGDKDGNIVLVNETIGYNLEDNNVLCLHIRPAPISDIGSLLSKIMEGFSKVANKIRNGELVVDNIKMESWMLAGGMAEKAKLLLGNDIKIEEAESSDQNVFLPLQYNSQSLKKYLTVENENDALPKIGRVTMTKEQFLSRFGG